MHPFHNLSVFGSSLFSAMHGSLVTSTLLSESIAQLSSGYVYVRKIDVFHILAHGYFGHLLFQFSSFNNSKSLHFLFSEQFSCRCSIIRIHSVSSWSRNISTLAHFILYLSVLPYVYLYLIRIFQPRTFYRSGCLEWWLHKCIGC